MVRDSRFEIRDSHSERGTSVHAFPASVQTYCAAFWDDLDAGFSMGQTIFFALRDESSEAPVSQICIIGDAGDL